MLRWIIKSNIAVLCFFVSGVVCAATSDTVLSALGFDPVALDSLVARTGWSASALNIRLLELELDGQVARLPGQLFQRIAYG